MIREWIRLDQVDSTNRYALERPKDGLLVTAGSQTKGKGSRGRSWYSPAGNLYMTLCLKDINPLHTIITGISVYDALITLVPGHEIIIKWPNDLLLNKKKVCGILCQSRSGFSAIGIGLNINQAFWPEELRETATSIYQETGQKHPALPVMYDILDAIKKWIEIYNNEGFAPVRKAFFTRSLIFGTEVMLEGKKRCRVMDIDMDGHLIVVLEGKTISLAGEKIFIVPQNTGAL